MGIDFARIKGRREALGVSQAEFARVSGCPLSTFRDIEAGVTRFPRIDTYKKIINALTELESEKKEVAAL